MHTERNDDDPFDYVVTDNGDDDDGNGGKNVDNDDTHYQSL